jgi:hypothetical protein
LLGGGVALSDGGLKVTRDGLFGLLMKGRKILHAPDDAFVGRAGSVD